MNQKLKSNSLMLIVKTTKKILMVARFSLQNLIETYGYRGSGYGLRTLSLLFDAGGLTGIHMVVRSAPYSNTETRGATIGKMCPINSAARHIEDVLPAGINIETISSAHTET